MGSSWVPQMGSGAGERQVGGQGRDSAERGKEIGARMGPSCRAHAALGPRSSPQRPGRLGHEDAASRRLCAPSVSCGFRPTPGARLGDVDGQGLVLFVPGLWCLFRERWLNFYAVAQWGHGSDQGRGVLPAGFLVWYLQ